MGKSWSFHTRLLHNQTAVVLVGGTKLLIVTRNGVSHHRAVMTRHFETHVDPRTTRSVSDGYLTDSSCVCYFCASSAVFQGRACHDRHPVDVSGGRGTRAPSKGVQSTIHKHRYFTSTPQPPLSCWARAYSGPVPSHAAVLRYTTKKEGKLVLGTTCPRP